MQALGCPLRGARAARPQRSTGACTSPVGSARRGRGWGWGLQCPRAAARPRGPAPPKEARGGDRGTSPDLPAPRSSASPHASVGVQRPRAALGEQLGDSPRGSATPLPLRPRRRVAARVPPGQFPEGGQHGAHRPKGGGPPRPIRVALPSPFGQKAATPVKGWGESRSLPTPGAPGPQGGPWQRASSGRGRVPGPWGGLWGFPSWSPRRVLTRPPRVPGPCGKNPTAPGHAPACPRCRPAMPKPGKTGPQQRAGGTRTLPGTAPTPPPTQGRQGTCPYGACHGRTRGRRSWTGRAPFGGHDTVPRPHEGAPVLDRARTLWRTRHCLATGAGTVPLGLPPGASLPGPPGRY